MLPVSLNPWINFTSVNGFVFFIKACPCCLDICDSLNNSVGYQNYFSVEYNQWLKKCFSANLIYISLYCSAWGTVNVSEGFCLVLGTSSEAPSTCTPSGKFRMCPLPCKVSYNSCTVIINVFYLALSMALKVLVRSPPFWDVPSIALTTSSFVRYVFKLNTTRGLLAY